MRSLPAALMLVFLVVTATTLLAEPPKPAVASGEIADAAFLASLAATAGHAEPAVCALESSTSMATQVSQCLCSQHCCNGCNPCPQSGTGICCSRPLLNGACAEVQACGCIAC